MKTWFWCLHCGRAFEAAVPPDWEPGAFVEEIGRPVIDRSGEVAWACPYDTCAGSPLDFIPWEHMRAVEPSFPARPETGTVYVPSHRGIMGTVLVLGQAPDGHMAPEAMSLWPLRGGGSPGVN